MLHNKFWQGFFALAPIITILVAVVAYIFFFFSLIKSFPEIEAENGGPPAMLFGGISTFIILIFLGILLSLGSLIFFILHAVQNPNLKENNLLLVWVLLFVFVSGIGQMIYWIIEILNKKSGKTLSE